MCIPHSAPRTISNNFEKGDPNFVDERTSAYSPKKKGSFFDNFFS